MATSKKVINHYEEMKKELEELHLADLSKTDIGNVISEFKCEINSVRVSSRVKDLRGVISILEARGSLLPEDPWALEKISGIVNRPFATKRISNYKHYIEAEALLNKIPNQEPAKKRDCRLQLTERVFEEASRHLVNDWRMFARSLELEENEIQLIENNNCDKQNAAKQVLEKFRYKNPEVDHISFVVNALKSISRYQLVRNIEAIIISKLPLQ